MGVPSTVKTDNLSVDIFLSATSGVILTLFTRLLRVQHFAGNGVVSDKFGLPFAWFEMLRIEVCSGFDCSISSRPIVYWPQLVLNISVLVAVTYLAVFSYRRLFAE